MNRTNAYASTLLAWALAGALAAGAAERTEPELRLHVPSPDWRDQIIYFVMVDRFADGDPDNNDQGAGEYDPVSNAHFNGGDLRGLAERVDYIRGLGATAVWITPPVANQWWNPATRYGGYHGYWATDFKAVDPHFGTLEDYRHLSDRLHRTGMYLVQDVVVNHTANYFRYVGAWDAARPARGFERIADTQGRRAPTQAPFDRNDARDPKQRAEAIYHWTPDIADFTDPRQEREWQLAGLDDLNTENPLVRRALRDSYGFWIREVGVDAFRVDTAFYVPPDYFRDFLHADDRAAPGVLQVARSTGRADFHVFGEGFGIDKPFDDAQMRKIDRYMRDGDGPLLPSMIQFPLYGTLGDVFARGRPPAELADRIERTLRIHADPHRMPTFVDNHDVDRFLTHGDEAGLKQALLALLTLPGIPVVYYGTEQGFTEQRAAMFAGGYGSGGRDRFDTTAPLYRWLREAIGLRRANRVFSRGTPRLLEANAGAPGALAYLMEHGGERALVVFNTAGQDTLLAGAATGLPPGSRLAPLFAIGGDAQPAQVDANGRLTLALPARVARVWRVGEVASMPPTPPAISIDPAPAVVQGDFELRGAATAGARLRLVVDGELAYARDVVADRHGRWHARVDTSAIVGSDQAHTAVLWDERTGALSPRHRFRVEREWVPLARRADPAGDDTGPAGRYRYPTEASWSGHRSLDIREVALYGAGGALRVDVRMADLVRAWNPANGFDHVAFTVFVELPGRAGGARAMPLQQAELPDGMRWHLRLRAHGWSNAAFAPSGADASQEGRPLLPAALLEADEASRTVRFVIPARALGNPVSLRGARVHVTTWDYDGGYRALSPEPQSGTFGGGDADDPRVMDAATVAVP